MTEIVDGLEAGEMVVAVGQINLRHGDRVRIGDEFNEIKSKVAQKGATTSVAAAKLD